MQQENSSKTLHHIFSTLESIDPAITDEDLIAITISLGEALLKNAPLEMSSNELSYHQKFNNLLQDQLGKAFFHTIADQCFRSSNHKRSLDQYTYLLSLYGLPVSLSGLDRVKFLSINSLHKKLPGTSKKMIYNYLLKNAQPFFLSASDVSGKSISSPGLDLHIDCYCSPPICKKAVTDHLGFYQYFAKRGDLSQITINTDNLLIESPTFSFEKESALFLEYTQTILQTYLEREDRKQTPITFFIESNLYHHDPLVLHVFLQLIKSPAYHDISLGLVLHSYFPDSYLSASTILEKAKERREAGGMPVVITLSKGKFLKKESQKASSGFYPQPCFLKREHTDANYKKILRLLIDKNSIAHCQVQVFTHNLLDIAYALALRTKQGIKHGVSFEMVQNLSSPLKKTLVHMGEKVVERKTYVPKRYEKQAIITLFRKISDQSNPYSFICSTCGITPNDSGWKEQIKRFEESIVLQDVPETPRLLYAKRECTLNPTFSYHQSLCSFLPQQQSLIKQATKRPTFEPITLSYLDQHTSDESKKDPHHLTQTLYTFPLIKEEGIASLLETLNKCSKDSIVSYVDDLKKTALKAITLLQQEQISLIQTLIYDLAMPFHLASQEVSTAIDFGSYALRSMDQILSSCDMLFTAKGTICIHPHPLTPLSTAAQTIFSSLLCGNTVIVAASPLCLYSLFQFTKLLWQAGFSKEQLMLIPADDRVLLTLAESDVVDDMHYFGYRKQALALYAKRGMKGFKAELEGKNTMIVTAMSDKNLALRHVIDSAFQFNGRHPFATSLLILEKEVYQDKIFKQNLENATLALECGPAYELTSSITPMIGGLSQTREEVFLSNDHPWLIQPKKLSDESALYSPGIVWGAKRGSYFHSSPVQGPLLAVMSADNLDQAIYLANNTPFGLAASIESLDMREHKQWLNQIKAGSRFINIPTTHLRVKKHPICSIKSSIIGPARSRGGPNSLLPFTQLTQTDIPKEKFPIDQKVNNLTRLLEKITLSAEELGIWYASIASYSFFFHQFKRDRDLVKVIGEDHTLSYRPRKKIIFRITEHDKPIDFLRILAATLTAHVYMEISWEKSPDLKDKQIDWDNLIPSCTILEEPFDTFLNRVRLGHFQLIRTISPPQKILYEALAGTGTFIEVGSPFSNGRFELLRYFHEIATSSTYHRFGNLGLREGEIRQSNY